MITVDNHATTQAADSNLKIVSKTMRVTFLDLNEEDRAVTVSRQAVSKRGVARHFTMNLRPKPSVYMKLLKALKSGSVSKGTMIEAEVEQGWDDDHHCNYLNSYKISKV